MKKLIFHFVAVTVLCTWGKTLSVPMFPDEHWWGVCNSFGTNMPFSAETREFKADLFAWNYGGQPASLLLSDQGRVVWCPEQTRVSIDSGEIRMESDVADVSLEHGGDNLRDAYRHAQSRYFPPSGKMPDPLFFSAPQYNTWMELTYNQNEKGIIDYAQSMLDHGLPPGRWCGDDGKSVEGPASIEVSTTIERLPHFVRQSFSAGDSACSLTTQPCRRSVCCMSQEDNRQFSEPASAAACRKGR